MPVLMDSGHEASPIVLWGWQGLPSSWTALANESDVGGSANGSS